MKSLLLGAALALAWIAPAAAANLGCYTTTTIKTNSSPSGTWRINGNSTVDYLQSMHEGVTALMNSLAPFNSGTHAICLDGSKTTISNKKVWQLSAVAICPFNRIANNFCAS